MSWGATPDDWAHFDLMLGLTADLLPVVSNPKATISPASKMKGLGKTPSIYNRAREVAGIPNWTDQQTTGRQVEKWAKEEDYGICIQTRSHRALDVDVPDVRLSERVVATFLSALGLRNLPARRRAGTGKQLLAFVIEGAGPELVKRSFCVAQGVGDDGKPWRWIVEFLATGQQFVAVGTHPSGTRYEWAGGLPKAFPTISLAQFERAWAALVDDFAIEPERRSTRRDGSGDGTGGSVDTDVPDPAALWLEANWETFGTQGGKLFVTCPWKAGHSGDSGETEAAWLLAGTNGYAMGHFECLHASCADRTDAQFLAAVGKRPTEASDFEDVAPAQPLRGATLAADDPVALYLAVAADTPRPEPVRPRATAPHPDMVPVLPLPGFERDGKGDIEATLPNVAKALAAPHACGMRLQYDTFRDELMIAERDTEAWVAFVDADAVDLRIALEAIRFKPIGKELMRDALVKVSRDRQFDSAVHWLNTVVPAWDGVERIASFYPRYMHTKDTAYTRACGRYVWTAHAGRILEPGCQADMVPVLIGEEGLRKSSGIRAISPDDAFFVTLDLDVRDDDLSRKMRGALVGELDELKGLNGRSAEAIKSWITLKFDEWTPKYMERKQRFWRRLVLHGTGNDREFMGPNTGKRRWLPMDVLGLVDVDAIVADRLQLWAEGRELWGASGVDYEEAEHLAKAEHASFTDTDPWLEKVGRWLDDADLAGMTPRRRGGLRSEDILSDVCGRELGAIKKHDQMRLAEIMKTHDMVRRQRWIDGHNVKAWEDEHADLS